MRLPVRELPEPSPDGASHRGREAFYAGVPRDNCPFPPASVLGTRWLEGWDGAERLRLMVDQILAREA